MVDGAALPVLLTARMSSSRLPGKHLLDMWRGRSALACLIGRIKAAGFVPVLCCGDDPADAPLRSEAAREGIAVFAGDPDHVLRRYGQAMEELDSAAAIIVDGDDAFVSTAAMQRIVALYDGHDLIECKGLPYGGAPYLMSRVFVEQLVAKGVTPNGWSQFLISMPGRKAAIDSTDFTVEDCALRLSLDYPEDLAFLRYLYDHAPRRRTFALDLEDVVVFVRAHRPSLIERFPSIFDGTVARRAEAHLASER
jgi:spore coat polysaccharide biosynthesis protein SpsF (cytidylyltransferase family)